MVVQRWYYMLNWATVVKATKELSQKTHHGLDTSKFPIDTSSPSKEIILLLKVELFNLTG